VDDVVAEGAPAPRVAVVLTLLVSAGFALLLAAQFAQLSAGGKLALAAGAFAGIAWAARLLTWPRAGTGGAPAAPSRAPSSRTA
jgi:hypothetical protein